MNEKDRELLRRMAEAQERIADTMPKPPGKFTGVLETAVFIVTIFSAVGIADTIMKWITGG
jgi:hypothetical protein